MQRRVTVFTRAAAWLGLPRLFKALRDNGFAVDLICVKGSFALNSEYLDRVLALGADASDQAWIEGLLSCDSETLLLGDDVAVDWLLHTCAHSSALENYLKQRSYDVARMAHARNKYTLAKLAAELDIPVPPIKLLIDDIASEALVAELGLPLVLKSALGFAGTEVFICRDTSQIDLARNMLQQAHDGFAQRYVSGTALMVPVACRNGQVLSKFAAVKRSTWPPVTGPSTIVEIADHPVAGEYVDKLVAALGLSGLISFDFVIDAQQRYWLMECNLRPVPVSHYKSVLVDAWLNNRPQTLPEGSNGLLALYPQCLIYPVDKPVFQQAVLDDQIHDRRLALAYQQEIAAANAQYAQAEEAAKSAPAPQQANN